jgi:hypothetical protein
VAATWLTWVDIKFMKNLNTTPSIGSSGVVQIATTVKKIKNIMAHNTILDLLSSVVGIYLGIIYPFC